MARISNSYMDELVQNANENGHRVQDWDDDKFADDLYDNGGLDLPRYEIKKSIENWKKSNGTK